MSGESTVPEPEESTLEIWLEFIPSVLMALAVLLTAYSAYQATRWSGVQATEFATASSLRTQASALTAVGITELSYDAGVFGDIALAYRGLDPSDPAVIEEVDEFADTLARDEFKPVLDEWLALEPDTNPDAPGTPFDLPSYLNENLVEAKRLTAEAELSFEAAKEANQNGDEYVLATIFFASVLFFTGLRLRTRVVRGLIQVLAAGALVAGIFRVATLPFH